MATSSFDKTFTISNPASIEKLLDLLDAPPSPRQQQLRAEFKQQQAEKMQNDEGLKWLGQKLARLQQS